MAGLLGRARRIAAGAIDTALDAAERASAPALMRGAVREAADAVEGARRAHDAAQQRLREVDQASAVARRRIVALGETADYAMSKDRRDLAEQALGEQYDAEQEVTRLVAARAAAATAVDSCAADLADLARRHAALRDGLSDGASRGGAAGSSSAAARMAHAEDAFERAVAASGSPPPLPGEGAIAALRREQAVAERLAARVGDVTPPTRRRARG